MIDRTLSAVLAAIPAGAGVVEVHGEGPLSQRLRAGVAADSCPPGGRPAVVVEVTGETDAIGAALRRVADLGTVVLVGPVAPATIALDLYADLHVRGLTVVGVLQPSEDGADAA